MRLSATQLSACSRLFSSAVFRQLAGKGKSPLFARLLRELMPSGVTGATVAEAFESAFSMLRVEACRDEYVYRSAVTHKVLLGTHSLSSASMLTEFRVAHCKADLAILNGTATVYEIKSERDSLSRLAKQVATYQTFFARVVVICGESHAEEILKVTPTDVGVLRLSKRHQISTLREATDRPDLICPVTVLDSLRSSEAEEILKRLGISVPSVPNTQLRLEMRALFAQLKPEDVHIEMIRTLKRSRDLAPLRTLVDQLPKSLQAAALSVPIKKSDHDKLVGALNTNLDLALGWGG